MDVLTQDLSKFQLTLGAYTSAGAYTEAKIETTGAGTETIPFADLERDDLCGYQRGAVIPPGVNPALVSFTCGTNPEAVDFHNLGGLQIAFNTLTDGSGNATPQVSVDMSIGPITAVPGPGIMGLLGIGALAGGLGFRRRRESKS